MRVKSLALSENTDNPVRGLLHEGTRGGAVDPVRCRVSQEQGFQPPPSGGKDNVEHLPLRTTNDPLDMGSLRGGELGGILRGRQSCRRPVIQLFPRAGSLLRISPQHILGESPRVDPMDNEP